MSDRLLRAAQRALPDEHIEAIAVGQERPWYAHAAVVAFVAVWAVAQVLGFPPVGAGALAGGLGGALFGLLTRNYVLAVGRRSMHLFRPEKRKSLLRLQLGQYLHPIDPGTVTRERGGLFTEPWHIGGRRLHVPRGHTKRLAAATRPGASAP